MRWRFLAGVCEVFLAGAFLALAVLWLLNPELTLEPSIVVVGAVAGALEIARRYLERPGPSPPVDELAPFPLQGIQLKHWVADPVIGASIQELDATGASFAIPLIHEVPRKLAEGYGYFLTEDGRRCHYLGRGSSGEEFVLLVRDADA